jgi:hypothetical protein
MIKARAPSIRPVDFSLLGFRFRNYPLDVRAREGKIGRMGRWRSWLGAALLGVLAVIVHRGPPFVASSPRARDQAMIYWNNAISSFVRRGHQRHLS